ncbi:hypothetical protein VNO77_19401 [Canavalia gladiata]|uniref:Uncharacterized protein n=1 Tax=Canavalia gladiata TaxID=3824 RepID=A0AAN9LMD5_CANGL
MKTNHVRNYSNVKESGVTFSFRRRSLLNREGNQNVPCMRFEQEPWSLDQNVYGLHEAAWHVDATPLGLLRSGEYASTGVLMGILIIELGN